MKCIRFILLKNILIIMKKLFLPFILGTIITKENKEQSSFFIVT